MLESVVARRRTAWHMDPANHVIGEAFRLAGARGGQCRPVHLVQALAETGGELGEVLRPVRVEASAEATAGGGVGSTYVLGQTQAAASLLAVTRGEERAEPHLALALLDQADPEVLRLLEDAGIDAAAVRHAALRQLGAPVDLAPISMPPLTPAGTLDRPALDIEQLDPRAWRVLTWRQEHLPLGRVRSAGQFEALGSLEQRAAWRITDQARVDDDQRYSLLHHHRLAVEARLAPAQSRFGEAVSRSEVTAGWDIARLRRRRRAPNFMVGWPTWFANRRVGIRDRWFRLVSTSAYRGQPRLKE